MQGMKGRMKAEEGFQIRTITDHRPPGMFKWLVVKRHRFGETQECKNQGIWPTHSQDASCRIAIHHQTALPAAVSAACFAALPLHLQGGLRVCLLPPFSNKTKVTILIFWKPF